MNIEAPHQRQLSDAGRATARRRRPPHTCSFVLLLLSSLFTLLFLLFLSLGLDWSARGVTPTGVLATGSMSTIYVNAHSFAALDLASELFYGAQSPLNHKPSLLDLRSGSEPFSENLRRLLSITFVHGLAAGMVGGGWTSINESSALHFKTDTTSILDARVPLLSRQPKLKTRCRFSSSIPPALCLTTCLTNLPEPSCSLQTKIASHDGSELSPQILAAVHNNESLLSLSFSDFIDQRLDFGSGKSLWLQHGNVGSESICLDSLPALLESIEKLILMSVDVKERFQKHVAVAQPVNGTVGLRVPAGTQPSEHNKKKHPTKNTVHIASNKNTVPGDVSVMVAGGIRMGTPALTSRGFVEEDFAKAVKLALKVKSEAQGTKMKDFALAMESSSTIQSEIAKLRHEVEEFAMQFPTIGFEN